MSTYIVSCLDTFAPNVQAAMQSVLPDNFEIRFAQSLEEEEHLRLASDADFLLVGGLPLTHRIIDNASRARLIQKWGIGIDKIDLAAAKAKGIPVSITAGANASPVAELAVGLMLSVYRRIPYADRNLRNGKWLKPQMRSFCYQLGGKTVGLLGFGAISRMVAKRLRGFDVKVIYHDIRKADPETESKLNAQAVSFGDLLSQSDVLSIHTPLTESTRHIIDANALEKMKKNAILINTARGGIVDEQALLEALTNGSLLGAGLDSFESEPLPANSRLLQLDNVVVTPHAGGGVLDNVENVSRHAFGNMLKILNNETLAPADIIISQTETTQA
ncbi:MAG: 2-hydroxyacid dehydrogenase [Advenella sp.]